MQNKSSQRTGSRDITGHRRRNPPGGTGKMEQYNKNTVVRRKKRKSYLNPKLSDAACRMMKRRMYLQKNVGNRNRNIIGCRLENKSDRIYKNDQNDNKKVIGQAERKVYLNARLSDAHHMMKRKAGLQKNEIKKSQRRLKMAGYHVHGYQKKKMFQFDQYKYFTNIKEKEVRGKGQIQNDSTYVIRRNIEIDTNVVYKSRKLRKFKKKCQYKEKNEVLYCFKVAEVKRVVTKNSSINRETKKEEREKKQTRGKSIKKGGFIKDTAVSVTKGQIQSLEGGSELLELADAIKKTAQETVSFVKTATDTGKSMYHAGKKTAETITGVGRGKKKMAGVRSRTEYNEKRLRSSHEKRKSQRHIDNKITENLGEFNEPESKKEKRKKKAEQKKQSIAKQRILTYIQNKSSGKQTDSIGSVAKDIVKNKAKQVAGRAIAFAGKKLMIAIGGALGSIIASIMPVVIVMMLVNQGLSQSPFAVFLPKSGNEANTETFQDVLYEYYVEFSNKIQKEADEDGYDKIQLKNGTGEIDGTNAVTTDNFRDVLCVFAEKYGYDDEIIEVTKGTKKKLKKVFQDMNSYSVSTKTKTKTKKNGQQVTKKIKTITITQKNWLEMADSYHFSEESKEELEELLGLAEEEGMGKELEIYTACASGDTCIDGKIYDDPTAPVYSGSCAKLAKKTRNYIRPILKSKGMEPYIDIIVSMVQQESTFGIGDNANWMQVNKYSGEAGIASVKAGINHFKGMLDICKRKHITDIYLLIQSYNMGPGYIDYAMANGGKDTKEIQRKFQYVQRPDGRYGTVGYSQSVMSRVKGQEPKTGKMPQYFQTDTQWNGVRFGTSTIGKSGCGVCSLSMVISYWTGKEVTPKILVERCHGYYVKGKGASWSMIPAIASQYNLRCKDLGTSKENMVNELKKGHTVIAIMHQGYFTTGGHFIVLRAINKNGKISVNDCGSRARTAKTYTAEFIQSNNAANYWAIYK